MRGNITRRGKHSWRLKFDGEPDAVTGKRRIRYQTVKGTRKDAEAELARLLDAAHKGVLPDASKLSVEAYLRQWLDGKDLSPRSREQYLDIIQRQIAPVLGKIELQRLKPLEVKTWLGGLRARDGRKLHARTLRHAYRVLHGALAEAVKLDMVARNVAGAVTPPKVEAAEVQILDADQIAALLDVLKGSRLHPIAALAFATGMRRGELLALRWQNVDLGRATLKVEQSLEQTKDGLRFKSPKSKYGRRTISLPPTAVAMLSQHRKEQLEIRMALGMGKPAADALVFCNHDGEPISPNGFSVTWGNAVSQAGFNVTFHACRHSHASALIAAGIDVVSVSRRLGHSSPVITLGTYAHLFRNTDTRAAEAIEKMLK
jgi:integrase